MSLMRIIVKPKPLMHNYALLNIYTDDEKLKSKYKEYIDRHNDDLFQNPFANSGFDLLFPDPIVFTPKIDSQFVNLKIKTEMRYYDASQDSLSACAYLLTPRSSISKTPLIMATSSGIIDCGYRGNIIGAFRNLKNDYYICNQYSKLLQICHPTLCPIFITMLDDEKLLSKTKRGNSNFGSTGV
jgi:hypothetical protein